MKRTLALLCFAGLLSACGGRVPLTPPAGKHLPEKGETYSTQASSDQLMTPDTQARPKRSDEQLKRSEERREDKFDLPPT
jgi:predicted small lipoprotein YifL